MRGSGPRLKAIELIEGGRPDAFRRVEGRIRDARGGKLNDAEFGRRMCGTGEMARQIGELFKLFGDRRRDGLRPGEPWRVQ